MDVAKGRYFLVGVEEHLLRCAGLKGVDIAAVCVGDGRELMISIIQMTALSCHFISSFGAVTAQFSHYR